MRDRLHIRRQRIHAAAPSAFTLIELLVVVAIIAMLISILLPSLSQAKEQSKMVKCGANLRQMGLALQMYLDDNEQFFPGEHNYSTSPIIVWAPRLRRYAGMQEKIFWCPTAETETWWIPRFDYFPPGPGQQMLRGFGYQPGERPLFSGDRSNADLFCYGYNSWGVGETWEKGCAVGLGAEVGNMSAPWVWSVRSTEVVRPAEMIAIADSKADANWDSAIDPETTQDAENPSKRHNGGAQVLYCDGHVTHGKTEKLIQPVDWARRQWNKDFLPHRELWAEQPPPPPPPAK